MSHGQKDWQELQLFAKDHLDLSSLEPWDMAYASEKLKQVRYAFSENEVKQYFPLPKVLDGLFALVQTLFGVKIEKDSLPVWHADVQSFKVLSKNGKLLANFYLDPYARPGKRGGAWMDDARGRRNLPNGKIQTPVAYLVCNFPAPVTVNGVEWDAVELPSQFMENFCWEWEVLEKMTSHVETGETLPKSLYEKMIAAKNFQNGMSTLRQLVFSLTDWRLHSNFDPHSAKPVDILQLSRQINDQVHVIKQSDLSRWPNTFSHIFAGGYSAGYYSYKWAILINQTA